MKVLYWEVKYSALYWWICKRCVILSQNFEDVDQSEVCIVAVFLYIQVSSRLKLGTTYFRMLAVISILLRNKAVHICLWRLRVD